MQVCYIYSPELRGPPRGWTYTLIVLALVGQQQCDADKLVLTLGSFSPVHAGYIIKIQAIPKSAN